MKCAFSLVELSIVLVILGLLTGGILTGQSLIRAAELRAVTTEFESFQQATNKFIVKYRAIPGDMPDATSYWGKLSAYCNAHSGTASNTGTCNGNGNGLLESSAGGNQNAEMFMYWNQLGLAGLIEGKYTGISGNALNWHTVYNQNIPASSGFDAGWMLGSIDYSAGDPWNYLFTYNYRNVLFYGKQTPNNWVGDSALTPENAWSIDKKIDDGKPGTGNILSTNWDNQCSAADDGTSAGDDYATSYRLSESSLKCTLIFRDYF